MKNCSTTMGIRAMCDYQTSYSGGYQANIIFQDGELVVNNQDLDDSFEDFVKLPSTQDEAQA